MYETYQFVPAGSADEDTGQFFVVQDDGTLMLQREIQYVAQAQDTKVPLQPIPPCTLYDITSQQYYSVVDNGEGLLPMSDQFVIPPNMDSNVYDDKYILQEMDQSNALQEGVEVSEIMEPEVVLQVEASNSTEEQENMDYTQVTLNDDQYRMLEQKGWVVLETYLLPNGSKKEKPETKDSMIAPVNNYSDSQFEFAKEVEAAVQTPRDQPARPVPPATPARPVPAATLAPPAPADLLSAPRKEIVHAKRNSKFPILQLQPKKLSTPQYQILYNSQPKVSEEFSNTAKGDSTTTPQQIKTEAPADAVDSSSTDDIVTIKTDFHLKDIPSKIFLGHAANGNRLVARMVSIAVPSAAAVRRKPPPPPPPPARPAAPPSSEMESAFEQALLARGAARGAEQTGAPGGEERGAAGGARALERVCAQLAAVDDVRRMMLGQRLLVTKMSPTGAATALAGRLRAAGGAGGAGGWRFEHVPDLLDCDKTEGEEITSPHHMDPSVLHIHVSEPQRAAAPAALAVAFAKRLLPGAAGAARRGCAAHACGACARLFRTERALREHIKTHNSEADDDKPPLVIDTDEAVIDNAEPDHNTKRKIKKPKTWPCQHCKEPVQARFYQKHLLSHFMPESSDGAPRRGLFQCKMCSTTYYHASTLSKHIMKHHIKKKVVGNVS